MFKFIMAAQVPTPKEFVIEDDKTFPDSRHIRFGCFTFVFSTMGPQNHQKSRFGPHKNRVITIKTFKNLGFGGPWYI